SLLAPILLHSGVAAGTLTPTAAADLGLPAGLPVAAGAADTAAAALGTGLLVPGRTQLTIGTGVQIVSIVTGPGTHDAASLPTAPSPSASSYAPTEAETPVTHLCRDSTPHGWEALGAPPTRPHPKRLVIRPHRSRDSGHAPLPRLDPSRLVRLGRQHHWRPHPRLGAPPARRPPGRAVRRRRPANPHQGAGLL